MARTRIQLDTGENLELSNDISISLNFSIADIREPEKRDGNFSKTISIPASKTSNIFFKSAFEIDGYDNYATNRKAGATIFIDGLEQIKGYLQLLKIVREDKKFIYEVSIRGNVTNIFQEWGDLELSTLDLSAYDHTYNKTTQKASWSASVGVGYVYPMIDYGQTNGLTYGVDNFFPAIYVKQYIDTMFALIGKTYNSDFFDTDFFKRLIIPLNTTTLGLTTAQITARLISESLTVDRTYNPYTVAHTTQFSTRLIYNNEITDPANAYNTTTGEWVVPFTGIYKINASAQIKSSAVSGDQVSLLIARSVSGGTAPLGYNVLGGGNATYLLTTTYQNIYSNTPNVLLYAGETIVIIPLLDGAAANTVTIHAGELQNICANISLVDGDAIAINSAIPQKIKIKDFFKSIISMFNLFIETDKTISNQINIEPRDDFYSAGVVKNWTSKLALDKAIELTPMGDLNSIEYQYAYKADKDFYNAKYNDSWQQVFGTHRKIIDNDFIKSVTKTEIIFSPTPLVQIGTTDRVLSQIVNVSNGGGISDVKTCNLRILYYGGVFNTVDSWQYTGTTSGTTTETTYPYAGHLDVPLQPTLDINFGVPYEIYYNTNYFTNNNLYNRFYKKYIEEITDVDSKVLTAYLNLTPFDIYTLDFRNKFLLDRSLLRLNKIFDYDPVNRGLTKCEFIKVKEATTFVASNIFSNGGIGNAFTGGEILPTLRIFNAYHSSNFIAENNVVDTTVRRCIVTGSGNFVGAGCENISLQGCTNCVVLAGVSNVTMVNSDGVIATESNTSYTDGLPTDTLLANKSIQMSFLLMGA